MLLKPVQVRLMGEAASVRQWAAGLARSGALTITGESVNRDGSGIRLYGLLAMPAERSDTAFNLAIEKDQ